MNCGEIIKTLRKQNGYTQQKLGKIISVSQDTVSNWERGKSLPPTAYLHDLAAALGVSVNELLGGEL